MGTVSTRVKERRVAHSDEEPEGSNAAFQAPAEQYFEEGSGQQPAPVLRGRAAGTSPQQGRTEPPGQPNLGQAAPAALPEVARRGRSNREPPRQTSIGSSAATGSV